MKNLLIINQLIFILGAISGILLTWFFSKNKNKAHLHILKKQLSSLETEHKNNQHKNTLLQEKNTQLETKLATLSANYQHLQEKLHTQKQDVADLQKTFQTQFENLTNKIFDEKSSRFVQQNKESLNNIMKPFQNDVQSLRKKVEDSYQYEAKERNILQGEIKKLHELNQHMSQETQNLTNALKGSNKLQGNFGEIMLETLLEKSGLIKGEAYTTQTTFTDQEGKRQQPDVILHLPENKHMVIDAKVTLTAYSKYTEATTKHDQALALKEHLLSIKAHIKGLSKKNYQQIHHINSPDFVFMFLPVEPAYTLACQADSSLFTEAFSQNIVIVTPSNLLATLQIIASIWKQEKQNKYALEIAQQGGALYDKFAAFLEDFEKIGKQLSTTNNSYNTALNKLSTGKGSLVTRAEKIKALGAKTTKHLPPQFTADTTLLSSNESPISHPNTPLEQTLIT
ncbi:MAG: DNA recombination protein RmuC [bacterium]